MFRFLYNRDQVCFVLKSITCISCQLTETQANFPYHSDNSMSWKFSLPQTYLYWAQPSCHKAAAYKTQKSWEWEALFLLLVSVENYTSSGWNTVYDHTGWSSTSPAVCNFTGEYRAHPHLPGSALVLARRLLAVPWLWQGPPWMGQGPVALSCTSLWWECH